MRTIYLMFEIEATDEVPEPSEAAAELRDAIDVADAWPSWVYTVDGQDAIEPDRGSMMRFSKMLTSASWPEQRS